MNALESRNRTLGELMTELRARLGFVAVGAASKGNEAILKSFLQESHDYVFNELQPPARRITSTIKLQANSRLYDWNDDERDMPIDPDTVISVWVRLPDSELVQELHRGITEPLRSDDTIRTYPERYDILGGQLEVYPIPDQVYDLVIDHRAMKSRFERASDRTSVPDRLVFLYALATAKAHYRHPDAQASATAFANMLRKEKFKQKGSMRFHAQAALDQEPDGQVVKTPNGYRLKV